MTAFIIVLMLSDIKILKYLSKYVPRSAWSAVLARFQSATVAQLLRDNYFSSLASMQGSLSIWCPSNLVFNNMFITGGAVAKCGTVSQEIKACVSGAE